MADIPESEKLAIATHFLLSSPPGEIKEVLADVKVVLNPPTILNDGVLKGVFRKYNTTNNEVFEGPDGKPVVLSEFGELDPKHYLTGTDKNEVLVVDHVAHSATKPTGDAPAATPGAFESARLAVYAALKDYVDAQYAEGVAAVGVFETKDGLVAVISGVKTNLRNYWSGKWRSEWTIDPKAKTCSGSVHIVVHYFEDGNVQMEQAKTIEKAGVPGGDDKALAEGVKAFVAKSENAISEALETLYQNMSEESFKDMRRVLPVTKSKMDWTGAATKLAMNMGKGKGQ